MPEQHGHGQVQYDGTEQRERRKVQHGALASMWTNLFWNSLCCCSWEEVGRIVRITTDTLLIIRISTTLLTRVGFIVAISKSGEGGICWRRQGTTMDASLEVQWLSDRLAASGGVVVIGYSSSSVGERRGHKKAYA